MRDRLLAQFREVLAVLYCARGLYTIVAKSY